MPKMTGLSESSWFNVTVKDGGANPNWHSLVTQLDCDNKGFLSYMHELYNVEYRGYPHGIKLEIPNDAYTKLMSP